MLQKLRKSFSAEQQAALAAAAAAGEARAADLAGEDEAMAEEQQRMDGEWWAARPCAHASAECASQVARCLRALHSPGFPGPHPRLQMRRGPRSSRSGGSRRKMQRRKRAAAARARRTQMCGDREGGTQLTPLAQQGECLFIRRY